jgi:SAM-dependent methyltransferase
MNIYFNPKQEPYNYKNMINWYNNLFIEFIDGYLSEVEKEYVFSNKRNASERIIYEKLRRNYFYYAFSRNFLKAVRFLFDNKACPCILDLGCGIGTQSLFFALSGAKVIAVDLDAQALAIFKKRIVFYEAIFNCKLDITIICENTVEYDYKMLPKFDGVFSMFAFNMMQPPDKLMGKLIEHMNFDARLAILDGNNLCWVAKLLPSRKRNVWSPKQFREYLIENGFEISLHKGGVVFPYCFWIFKLFNPLVFLFDVLLRQGNWFFSLSQLILAKKRR